MKIIQISSASSSFSVKDSQKDIFRGWYAKVARQIKKNKSQLDVECWTPEKNYKEEKTKLKEDIKFRIFPTNFSLRHGMEISFSLLKSLRKLQKEGDKKGEKLILHIHEYHSWLAYLILFFADKDKVKIIAQHHGGRNPTSNLRVYKRLFLFFPLIFFLQFIEELVLKKVDYFYALSDAELTYLKKVAPNTKRRFQTMGINEEYFKKEGKNISRRRIGLDLNKKYVLYIGRIKTTKGMKELLDSMKELDSLNLELLLIGEGADFLKYNSYVQEKNIHNVKFLGAIYGEKKLSYLNACNGLILPSHTEGAPVVLMEAIAKNLPVVATNVGGIPKMIKNGREGILIDPYSKKEIVYAIQEILKWKDKEIRTYAKKYLWKRIIKDTIRDYKE